MKKIRKDELVAGVEGIIAGADGQEEAAQAVVSLLQELQDASGLKICQAVPKEDLAYKEVM